MGFVVFILVMFLPAIVASFIGGSKDRGVGIWFVLGFIFSWLAVLIVACLSSPEGGTTSRSETLYSGTGPNTYIPEESSRVKSSRQAAWDDFNELDVVRPDLEDKQNRPGEYCPICAEKVSAAQIYCPHCGAKLRRKVT